jgi:hypothetical protein
MFGFASSSAAAGLTEFKYLLKGKKVHKLPPNEIASGFSLLGRPRHVFGPKMSPSAVKANKLSKHYSLGCAPSRLTSSSSSSSLSLDWLESELNIPQADPLELLQQGIKKENASLKIVKKNISNAAEAAMSQYKCGNKQRTTKNLNKFKAYCAEYEILRKKKSRLEELYNKIALRDGECPVN